jgi:hypothetical protein
MSVEKYTALDHIRYQYAMMEQCLDQIRIIASDNDYKDLEQTCIMFETDLKEVEAAINEVRL